MIFLSKIRDNLLQVPVLRIVIAELQSEINNVKKKQETEQLCFEAVISESLASLKTECMSILRLIWCETFLLSVV